MKVTTRPSRGLCAVAAELGIDWAGIRWFCFRVIPGNVFGLAIYAVQLVRGRIAPETRKSVSIALAIGWSLVIAAAIASLIFPPGGAAMGVSWAYTAFVSGFLAVLAGSLVYNRVNYGFYL
ncbi:hypothetical protein A2763_02985 [Candidatus Kaiserbacteria bacterium RIFCSPHIGHO2_01_FULL_54_36]|uniref:Uncharacterized protein n=1 Tax=Candidatus Kaiserbacteria bacterium RIFCSPHIGHO2_01_FULL_54_36 TaxID=1798482 RepID=A0A1F6CK46_9BACT|nr:MAG: hypothetical protein A2763_02985 [Candidatus Kaiserbacteria bacterium RIFCSPHIGHO2_01_FULL_54_36]OGG75367.1 MAG: hypothetical protein A3A41_02240 [Candidatus Kaiserbacteria bacterium RIFCSPLOWO2_01_FULL_54_22]